MPRPGPRRPLVALRLSGQGIEWLDGVARDEGFLIRDGEPNRSEAARLALAYAQRHMPKGWRPKKLHVHDTSGRTTMTSETGFGTLMDASTGDEIGPATREQCEASDEAGETGIFLIDRDGDPCDESSAFAPLRTVRVQP